MNKNNFYPIVMADTLVVYVKYFETLTLLKQFTEFGFCLETVLTLHMSDFIVLCLTKAQVSHRNKGF